MAQRTVLSRSLGVRTLVCVCRLLVLHLWEVHVLLDARVSSSDHMPLHGSGSQRRRLVVHLAGGGELRCVFTFSFACKRALLELVCSILVLAMLGTMVSLLLGSVQNVRLVCLTCIPGSLAVRLWLGVSVTHRRTSCGTCLFDGIRRARSGGAQEWSFVALAGFSMSFPHECIGCPPGHEGGIDRPLQANRPR